MEVFLNALKILSKVFYKILEIDLNTDCYFEVKVDEKEKSEHKYIKAWTADFAEENVHPEDKERFLNFFDAEETKKQIKEHWMRRCFYRRKVENEWRITCMEVVPMDNYSDEDAIVLLTVRDVDDYFKDFRKENLNF